MIAAGYGCTSSTLVAGVVGSTVGSTIGGQIGSFGGPIAEKIGEIGGGLLGGNVGSWCFAAGTRVVVAVNADGSYATKSIEDIQVGDYVLARPQNDATAPVELKQVTAVYVHQVSQEQVLTVSDAQGHTETITCTAEHPFWVEGRGWTPAKDLVPGMELSSPDGSMVVVVSNATLLLDQPVNVYNFQVDGDHTYFVGDDAEPVWVHNMCKVDPYKLEKMHLLPQAKEFAGHFGRAKLNIQAYVTWLSAGKHRLVAYGGVHCGKGALNWNGAWRQFFAGNRWAKRQEILDQLAKMRAMFGI
jgi:hypothetical protein